MQVMISDARRDGKPAITAHWNNKLPGVDAPPNMQQGAMWLYYIVPGNVEMLRFADDGDWQQYTTTIDAEQVRVVYTVAANLQEMRTEAFRLAAVAA